MPNIHKKHHQFVILKFGFFNTFVPVFLFFTNEKNKNNWRRCQSCATFNIFFKTVSPVYQLDLETFLKVYTTSCIR